jgi:dimethylamine monooxygenase subunit A
VHGRVVATLPGSEPASADLLEALLAHLERHHPGTVTRRPDGTVEDTSTASVIDPTQMHPIDAAGRLVQEDLCLMERIRGSWTLTAASVCFPSRWNLATKLGRDLSAIHDPVPGYAETLARPADALFDRLHVERPVWRLNWTLIDRPDLHQPDPAARRRPPAALVDPGRQLWFRVERQTLRRLTDRPAVTFTIRTYATVLDDLLSAHPDAAGALRATLATVPPDTLAYKGWDGIVGPLLAWLDRPR